jgi:predicted ATPase/DNA-binding CsgD family transcriptional regulator
VTVSLVSPVVVGRTAESRALADALGRALGGEAVAVLVGGEAGIGKSRLIGELVGEARSSGARALVGGCVELDGGGIPFAPLVDMFRALGRDLGPSELKTLLGPAGAEMSRLVPGLGDGRASEVGADRDPARILELILATLDRLAASGPLVVVFEDVQWADRGTLDLLALLVAGTMIHHLLVVCTVRSDELHRAHPFRRVAARWEQQRTVERLELDRLAATDVAAQIEAILGKAPDGELVEMVFERSEGIPLFVEELLGAVRDGGLDRRYLPPSLRDVVLARAERLSGEAQHILRVASAAGGWVSEPVLVAVTALPDVGLHTPLRELIEHQLLVIDPSGRGYGFRHSLAQEAIHDDLLPGERVRLHRLYAEALEQEHDPSGLTLGLDTSSRLAYHWLAAHDLPRALAAAVRAGRAAASATAASAALRQFEIALELWAQVPDASGEAEIGHVDLLEAAADAAYRSGALDRSLALVDEALAEAGHEQTVERRGMLLALRAGILRDLSRDSEGIEVLEQAVSLLTPDSPTRVGAHLLNSLARALMRVHRFQRARVLAQEAISAARAVGAVQDELDAQITFAHALLDAGEDDRESALDLLSAAQMEARRLGLAWIATRAAINLSDALLMLGRWEEAVSVVDEALPLAQQAGLSRTAGSFLRSNKGEALLRAGQWDAALACTAPGTEAPGVFAATRILLSAEISAGVGRREQAERELREARRQLHNTTASQFALPLAVLEAELARSGGALDEALEVVQRALARPVGVEDVRYLWPVLSLSMRIEAERAVHLQDAATAGSEEDLRRAEALRARADRTSAMTPADRGHKALTQAEYIRLTGGDPVAAWSEAVQACRAMCEPYPLAYALLRASEALAGAGDLAAAAVSAREGRALARRMGAAPLADEIEALVRRARLPVDAPNTSEAIANTQPGPGRSAPRYGLTSREREVLGLVAEGRSNSEIAQHLFISRKTASVHVSNILAKLGVNGRVQAAALAHRQGLTHPGPVSGEADPPKTNAPGPQE